MLNSEQLSMAKSQPKEFLLQSQALYIRLKGIMNELSIEEETIPTEDRMRTLVNEAKAIKEQRTDIYNLVKEKVVDDTYKYILIAHYLQDKTIPELCAELSYSRRWLMRLQARALKALSDAI